tara:strand:+ start:1184 stop:1504 length:321 start_codon:yes stop_codon:yes gene_type:complete
VGALRGALFVCDLTKNDKKAIILNMKEDEKPISETALAAMTILSAAFILLAWSVGSTFAAFFATLSMVIVRAYSLKYYKRKLDKFYLIAYSIAAVLLIIFEILIRI